ncbi:MAG TPA: cytochrome c [Sphingomicrobium sp.]|jgi:cytochrome c556|nr:cytochrome c [Sphingomicrobium sp.]
MRRVTIAVGMIAVFAAAAVAAPLTKGRALAIMHQRHEGMEKIGDTNKLLRREITSSSPFVPAIQSGAATIAGLSVKANGWFPRGTGPELGKTGARPQIWQTPQDFIAKLHNFQGAAQAFNAAAKSGDMNAIKARYADLNGACKACHDKYRMDMHH